MFSKQPRGWLLSLCPLVSCACDFYEREYPTPHRSNPRRYFPELSACRSSARGCPSEIKIPLSPYPRAINPSQYPLSCHPLPQNPRFFSLKPLPTSRKRLKMQKYRRFLRFFLHICELLCTFVRFLRKRTNNHYKNTNLWQTMKN